MALNPNEPQYVPVEENGQEVEPAPTPIRDLCGVMGLLDLEDKKMASASIVAPEEMPEAGGIVFGDLIPEYDAHGNLAMNVGRISVTARDHSPSLALGNFLLTLASLEEQGIAIHFPQAPMQMARPTSPALRPAPDAGGYSGINPTPKPVAQQTPGQQQVATSEGIFTTTIVKVILKPLADGKIEMHLFEKAAFQYPFVKTFGMSREDVIKNLNTAGVDGEAMVKVVTTSPQTFTTAEGIGLAWREGKSMVKDPTKHYKNFVGLYDLAQGWV